MQKKAKKICKKKRASRLEVHGAWRFGRMLDRRMSWRLYGQNIYIEHVMSEHFVGQSQSGLENWNKHVHDFVTTHTSDSIPFFFAFETDGKIFILLYPFFYLLFFINIFNQQQFSLTAMVLGRESSLMELFVETHVQSDDRQKRVQQLVDSRA